MLLFLPVPYEDELLYSILARYMIRSGNTSYRNTLEEAFSNKNTVPSIYLPYNIDAFTNNLPPNLNYTSEEIIYNHTLYNYFTAFMNSERSNEILNLMKGNVGETLFQKFGFLSLKFHKYLRFCPQCLKEDIENKGETYWRRSHQIPSVMICTKHKILLQDSSVHINLYNKYEIIAANESNCIPKNTNNIYTIDTFNKLYTLSLNSEYLLYTHLEKKDKKWYTDNYRSYLKKNKLASIKGGVIKQNKLYNLFKEYYSNDILEEFNCNLENNNGSWIRKIFFTDRQTINPIKNLLILQFLKIDIKKFFTIKYTYNHFGNGPWPCLNSQSNHYRQARVNKLELGYNRENGFIKGKFLCDCGFKYTITSKDSFENILENIDTNFYSNLNDNEKFLEILDNHSDKINISLNHNRLFSNDYKTYKNKFDNPYLYKHRYEWIKLRKQYPFKSKSELISLSPTTGSWLYKFDREWLDENSPSNIVINNTKSRIKWESFDLDVISKVENIVNSILESDEKPIRITKTMITKMIKQQYNISIDLDKLTKTKAYLDEKIETFEEFRMRKIKWAIKLLDNNNDKLTYTNVANTINLSSKIRKEIKSVILNEIDEYNNKKQQIT